MALKRYNSQIPMQPDEHSGALITTSFLSYATHAGGQFQISHYNLTLADTATIGVAFTVPTGIEMHIKNMELFAIDVPYLFTFYPFVSSYTPGVSSKTPRNAFISATAPSSAIGSMNLDPTSIVTPAPIQTFYFGGGSGIAATHSSGIYSPSSEIIITAGTYAATVQNLTGAANLAQMRFSWLEFEV